MGLEWGATSLLIRIICNIHSNDEHQGRCSFPSSHSNLFGSSRHPACQDLSWFLSMSRCLQKWVLPLGSWAQEPCQVRTYTFRCLHEQADKKLMKELGVGVIREWWGVWQAESLCCWWALVHCKVLWEWKKEELVGGTQLHRSPAVHGHHCHHWSSSWSHLAIRHRDRWTNSFQAELCGALLVAGGREEECAGERLLCCYPSDFFSLSCIPFFRAFVTIRNYPVYLAALLPVYFLLQSECIISQPLELEHKEFNP